MEEEKSENEMMLEGRTKVGDLEFKKAGILCYLPICAINLIASLVVLNSEPHENKWLRFHAMQSLMLTGAYIAAAIATGLITGILGMIPLLGWALALIVNLAFLAATGVYLWMCVIGLIAASNGQIKKLPYVGEMAEARM